MAQGMTFYREIRWHGRGGHGLVSTSNLLCEIAVRKGLYAQSIPIFGAERRGAPTVTYTILSDRTIRKRSSVVSPDVVIVTDVNLFRIVDVTSGLKEGGYAIVNAKEIFDDVKPKLSGKRLVLLDAFEVALRSGLTVGGTPIASIPLLGALFKVLELIEVEVAEEVIREKWPSEIAERNIRALKGGMEAARVVES